jgi:hypothetical protein
MSDPITPTTMGPPEDRRLSIARWLATGASLVAGAIYLLIGLGIVSIGESTIDGANDLFAFGLMMTAVSVAMAAVTWIARGRALLIGVAIVQVVVLVGYVAFSGVREPTFELWGILIKVCQAAVLGAVVYLLAHRVTAHVGTPGLPKGHAA